MSRHASCMIKEKPSQKPPVPDSEFDARAEQERDSRPERIARLKATVDRLFPGEKNEKIRSKIEASFQVPQWGEYHNEGLFMDTHLDLILNNLEQLRQGEMPASLPEETRVALTATASGNAEVLEKYVFLHDISKMDTLLVKKKGPDGKSVQQKVSWDEWQASVPPDAQGDPVAMRAWLKQNGIEGISYYHPSEQGVEGKQHGQEGADEVRELGLEIDPAVLVAIENHEVAYQFSKPKAETYRKYFGKMTDGERNMALTASYIDTAASLGKNGEPDLSNFQALVESKRGDELIGAVEGQLPSTEGLDPKKVAKLLADLKKAEMPIPEKTPEQLLARFKKECKFTVYNPSVLDESLTEIIKNGQIDDGEKQRILELVRSGQADQIGKQFGPKMRFISAALKSAEKK